MKYKQMRPLFYLLLISLFCTRAQSQKTIYTLASIADSLK